MLPSEAIKVVPFDARSGDVGPLQQRAFLSESWKRGFRVLDEMEINLGYLEARLVELLRPEDKPLAIVRTEPAEAGAAPFTQRLATLIARMEEQLLRVESLQRRLDV